MITTSCPCNNDGVSTSPVLLSLYASFVPAPLFYPYLGYVCWMLRSYASFQNCMKREQSYIFSELTSFSQFLIIATRRCLLCFLHVHLVMFFCSATMYIDRDCTSSIIRPYGTLINRGQQLIYKNHHFLTAENI